MKTAWVIAVSAGLCCALTLAGCVRPSERVQNDPLVSHTSLMPQAPSVPETFADGQRLYTDERIELVSLVFRLAGRRLELVRALY